MFQQVSPIVIDLGKMRRKAIKELKRGEGKVLVEVRQALEEVRAGMGTEADGKELIPVVLIYKKKTKRPKGLFGM